MSNSAYPASGSGLVEIGRPGLDVELDIAYATALNITGRPLYSRPAAYLHQDAAALLSRAVDLARPLGFRLRIFDAFRPAEAQWRLWRCRPDPEFVADPRRGSPHSRGVAVDLTLIDDAGHALDMGTAFDAFEPRSHHGVLTIQVEAQRNRLILLGLMNAAGWDFYTNEWWHYQMFSPARYPVLSDSVLTRPMLAPD